MTPHNNPARKFFVYPTDDDHLGKLPPEQLAAVHTIDVLGFGYEAAAAYLGIPIGTVKTRTHRGRAKVIALRAAAATKAGGVENAVGA